jgi:hypothetical protein
MAISVVNGFLCYSSCDVAKAAKGHNPHPQMDATTSYLQQATDASRPEERAVVLGGTLTASAGTDTLPETAASAGQAHAIDISA